jgi:hypothetical protein
VTVKITIIAQGNSAESPRTIALARGQDASFSVTKPGTGDAKVEVLVNGTPVVSTIIKLQ